MPVREVQRSFIFPRIPLNFTLPDDYPAVGNMSNISVIPVITNFKFTRDELELEGEYQLAVSFYKADPDTDYGPPELRELESDDFFSHLKLEADGLFSDSSAEVTGAAKQNSSELYTAHFSRPFHTYVDLECINRPRSFRPGMVVEKFDLDAVGGRTLKGELILGLINRPRRNSW